MQLGLYDSRHGRDGCVVGFVADVAGRPSHDILEKAFEAVAHLDHRGAVSADGKTGDGAGVLTQIPRRLFARVLEERGLPPDEVERLGVGMLFLPEDDAEAREAAREIVEQAVIQAGPYFLGWRDVLLRGLVETHHRLTGSARAAELLADCGTALGAFRKVVPQAPEDADEADFRMRLEAWEAFAGRLLEGLEAPAEPVPELS